MNTEVNLEVADKKLREIVDKFRGEGLPKPIPVKEALKDLSMEQKEVLCEFVNVTEKVKEVKGSWDSTSPGDDFWKTCNELRKVLQDVIKLGLIYIETIQKRVVFYGALPDPKYDWKYYFLPDRSYACWDCGKEVSVKVQRVSIHDDFGVGSGRVKLRKVLYCPECEKEPPDNDLVIENPADDIAADWKGITP